MNRTRIAMTFLLSLAAGAAGCAEEPLTGEDWAVVDAASVDVAAAVAPEKTVNAPASLAYALKGLQHNVAVQKAYIASTYVYVTQRSGGTCYLSRLLINGSEANFVDEMKVTNAGHCQTLDMYTYEGDNYFYFSSKAEHDDANDTYWSLQVARLQYEAGATRDYTDLRRFTYLNYANRTGERLGTTYRVDGGGNSTHTFLRVQTKEGTVTWSVYDTVALNRLLDDHEQVRLDSAAAVAACVTSFTQSGSGIIRPNGSFQGGDLLGASQIYTSGGAEGETPQIARISSGGAYKALVKVSNVGTHEIEGVQNKNGNVYFTIVTDPVNKKNTQKIYYVSDDIF